ncbi:hypothetical protein PG987_000601 [Apiospora arundinis]
MSTTFREWTEAVRDNRPDRLSLCRFITALRVHDVAATLKEPLDILSECEEIANTGTGPPLWRWGGGRDPVGPTSQAKMRSRHRPADNALEAIRSIFGPMWMPDPNYKALKAAGIDKYERLGGRIIQKYFPDKSPLTRVHNRLVDAVVFRSNRVMFTRNGNNCPGNSEPSGQGEASSTGCLSSTGSETGKPLTETLLSGDANAGSTTVGDFVYSKWPTKSCFFSCPFCPQTLPEEYATRDEWCDHVGDDLLPYVCIFDKCSFSADSTSFQRKWEWIYHMRQCHIHLAFLCMDFKSEGKEFTFKVMTDWYSHRAKVHNDNRSYNDPQDISCVQENAQKIHCPLCEYSGPFCFSDIFSMSEHGKPSISQLGSNPFNHIADRIYAFTLDSLAPSANNSMNYECRYPSNATAQHIALVKE